MFLVIKDQILFWGPLDPMVDRGLSSRPDSEKRSSDITCDNFSHNQKNWFAKQKRFPTHYRHHKKLIPWYDLPGALSIAWQ